MKFNKGKSKSSELILCIHLIFPSDILTVSQSFFQSWVGKRKSMMRLQEIALCHYIPPISIFQ